MERRLIVVFWWLQAGNALTDFVLRPKSLAEVERSRQRRMSTYVIEKRDAFHVFIL